MDGVKTEETVKTAAGTYTVRMVPVCESGELFGQKIEEITRGLLKKGCYDQDGNLLADSLDQLPPGVYMRLALVAMRVNMLDEMLGKD